MASSVDEMEEKRGSPRVVEKEVNEAQHPMKAEVTAGPEVTDTPAQAVDVAAVSVHEVVTDDAVQIISNPPTPQEEPTLRERLILWKAEKKQKQQKPKATTAIAFGEKTSARKSVVASRQYEIRKHRERRATFSVHPDSSFLKAQREKKICAQQQGHAKTGPVLPRSAECVTTKRVPRFDTRKSASAVSKISDKQSSRPWNRTVLKQPLTQETATNVRKQESAFNSNKKQETARNVRKQESTTNVRKHESAINSNKKQETARNVRKQESTTNVRKQESAINSDKKHETARNVRKRGITGRQPFSTWGRTVPTALTVPTVLKQLLKKETARSNSKKHETPRNGSKQQETARNFNKQQESAKKKKQEAAQQTFSAWGRTVPNNLPDRDTNTGRRTSRLDPYRRSSLSRKTSMTAASKLLSKRPSGILKRMSCTTPSLPSSDIAFTRLGNPLGTAESQLGGAHSHVKFVSPFQTPTNQKDYRKTPSRIRSSCSEDSMRHQLSCWIQAKGRTPSKYRHLMCFDAAMSEQKRRNRLVKRSITVDQLSEQQKNINKENRACQNLMSDFDAAGAGDDDVEKRQLTSADKSVREQLDDLLQECHHLIDTGCPTETLLTWLENIYTNIAMAKQYVPFYNCKVHAVKRHGKFDDVIDVLSEAIRNHAQPAADLAELNSSTVREFCGKAMQAEAAHAAEESCSETEAMEDLASSDVRQSPESERSVSADPVEDTEVPFSILYTVSNVTPFKKRKHHSSCITPQHIRTVVTPVRRSTRRSIQPKLIATEKVVHSLSDLTDQEMTQALFRPNHALNEVVDTYL